LTLRLEERRWYRAAAASVLVVPASIGLALAASPSQAARPVRGAYHGFDGRPAEINRATSNAGFFELTAALRVSSGGRRLSNRGDGSYVRYGFRCSLDRANRVSGTIRLAGRRTRGPRIRRDGSFGLVKRRGDVRYRLRGRFVTRDMATLVYRATVVPQLPRNRRRPGRCTSPRTRVALFLNGEPPFRGCGSQPATTLLSSSTGRLLMQYRLTSQGFMPYVFACLFDVDRRYPVGQSYDDQDVGLPRLTGPFVAWVFECSAAGPCTGSIQVRDLRTGAFAHRRVFPSSSVPFHYSRFTDLELKDNASFAWIAVHYGMSGESLGIEVWALDGLGRRMLDAGADINPASLRLEDSTLKWEKGGVEQSATLN
jgi:hypothetical protein